VVRLPRGIWHDRISRRPTTRRRSLSGASTDFRDDMQTWCARRGFRYTEIGYDGPEVPVAAVAAVMRDWYRARGEPATRLVIPCFHSGRPVAHHLLRRPTQHDLRAPLT
jgi:hypothetical protein